MKRDRSALVLDVLEPARLVADRAQRSVLS